MNEPAKPTRSKRVVLAIMLVAFALLAKPSDWYPRWDEIAAASDTPAGDNVVGGRAAVHIDGVLESPILCLDTGNIVGVNCNVDPADDSTWTFAPGSSATLEWGGFDGNAAPNLPTGDDANDLCRLTVLADNGATVIRTLHSATTCPALGTTFDYRLTTTGTSAGTPVAGTFRLRIEIRDFTAGVAQYQVDSDSDCADCIPETTFRGAIRAGMDVTAVTHSGYPSGSVHAYTVPTESMGFVVSHTPAQPNQASRAVQVKTVTDAQTVIETVSTSAETDGTTGASYQVTETYPAARTTLGIEWTITGNSALTGLKWTHINAVTGPVVADGEFEARRPALFDVDPRITATHLIKMNDNAFDSPPMSGDDCCTRLTSDLAFFATRQIGRAHV